MRCGLMEASQQQRAVSVLVAAACSSLLLLATAPSAIGQTTPRRTCLPVSERAGREVGCWIMASQPLGQLSQPAVFWHLDSDPTRSAAETAQGTTRHRGGGSRESLAVYHRRRRLATTERRAGRGNRAAPREVWRALYGPIHGGHLQSGGCDAEAPSSRTGGLVYDGGRVLRGDT
jgi:hypothetical protein